MLLQRLFLPPDNAADDTETRAFQNYDAQRQFFPLYFRRYVTIGAVIIAAVLLAVGVYFTLPEAEPEYRVVPNENIIAPEPTVDPLVGIPDTLAPAVAEAIGITVPARIDNTMPVASSRVYAFSTDAGITWQIRVNASENFAPTVTLYGPDGSIIDNSLGGQNAFLEVTLRQSGTYTLLIEDTFARGGTYTLWILPA
jgi:hypothetical protein